MVLQCRQAVIVEMEGENEPLRRELASTNSTLKS
jgi:hypothetical protein